MANGFLHGLRLARDVQHMVRDSFLTVVVLRPVSGSDERVACFQTRIAQATSAIALRDKRPLQGDAPDQHYVMPVPDASDVKNGDTVWAGDDRYRVIAVDGLPPGRQAILEGIQ